MVCALRAEAGSSHSSGCTHQCYLFATSLPPHSVTEQVNLKEKKKGMIVKIVKIYLALSLVLWAMWGHFQGGSLCLTSVCWSLQCLVSALTQGGSGGYFFFFRLTCSVALWGGRDAANKYHCRVLTVSQCRWACPCSRHTQLRLYIASPGTV